MRMRSSLWEREKAARGVDGRSLPWGSHFEPTWATVLDGFADRPGPRPVGHRPEDESIYGLRDLCGGVRDLCANAWTRAGGVQPTDWPDWMRPLKDY